MNLDRNIVIEASAGTGKTYTLVQTILQALFQKNLPMESLVALTFTKKAAGEMKERIAEELQKIDNATAMDDYWKGWGQFLDTLKHRSREALETIDRAAIGTIHSYAFSLLKRFPLEAGISPDAEVDEKDIRRDDLFEVEWPAWLTKELRSQGSKLRNERQTDWLAVLEKAPLSTARDLARRLCDLDIPLESLPLSAENLHITIQPFYDEIRALLNGKPDSVKSTRIAKACEEILGTAMAGEPISKIAAAALEETPGTTKDWPDHEVRRLKIIRLIARNLVEGGDETLAKATALLKPFLTAFRRKLIALGHLSNNALLVLARNLVANNPRVRETLKREIRIIFIDEFQDTDPLQGELLLFLAELPGDFAKRWDAVRLEPGKLFIVGDPKQSIYLFRGADISAYARITQMVMKQGGERRLLEESYRSHERIIHAVNAAFAPLIQERPPISPAYQPLLARIKNEDPDRHLVEIRLASSKEPQSSEDALKREAVDAADWIARAVAARRWTYKDIALIFRSTPAMSPFIEALRGKQLPFVVEGERYFYRTPEVTDLLNLIRALEDGKNRIALVGFLRSPLGGFTDAEIAQLQQLNGLRIDKSLPKELSAPAHLGAWDLVQTLRRRARHEPLKSVFHHIYEDTYLLELAARSYHQDQTLANLMKLRRLMETFAEQGETTLSGLLKKIDRFMEDDRLEGESPLADEQYDAVRLLTIHKAKGLEFPVVWLPGLHRNAGGNDDTTKVKVRYDWGSDKLGISLAGKARNMDDFALASDFDAREEAEDARVLYVAMTRACDHLILSGGVSNAGRYKQPASGSFLAQLAGAWKIDLSAVPQGDLALGDGVLTIHHITDPQGSVEESHHVDAWLKSLNAKEIAAKWKARAESARKANETLLIIKPSELREAPSAKPKAAKPERQREETYSYDPVLLGTLVHKFLEVWNFQEEKCEMPAKLRDVANRLFAESGILVSPFPDPKHGESPANNPPALTAAVNEAQRILADFIGSEDWAEIKGAEIVGREIPFIFGTQPLVRGQIDILYRLPSGSLVVGDYKTDRAQDPNQYAAQSAAYVDAVSRSLGEQSSFKLIYLRGAFQTV